MCGKGSFPICLLTAGITLMISAFFKNGAAVFLVGLSCVILSFALRRR